MNIPSSPQRHAPYPFRLYVITDPSLNSQKNFLYKVEQALAGGADWIQYRDKRLLTLKEKLTICKPLKRLCERYHSTLIINDDLTLAKRLNAGLHLGQGDLNNIKGNLKQTKHETSQTEDIENKTNLPVLGITCHNKLNLAQNALKNGADYVSFGACFLSQTKPNTLLCSLGIIKTAREALPGEICAIGGISLKHLPLVLKSGANIIAACNAIWNASDIEKCCAAYKQLMNETTVKTQLKHTTLNQEEVYET